MWEENLFHTRWLNVKALSVSVKIADRHKNVQFIVRLYVVQSKVYVTSGY